jgi:hypothetical protein
MVSKIGNKDKDFAEVSMGRIINVYKRGRDDFFA